MVSYFHSTSSVKTIEKSSRSDVKSDLNLLNPLSQKI